ncbi:MAG: sulfotransferase, partial [Cyclobacteriaceae bacterium]|nr:sulfotransferase [Cyclobacteriaceae bacterium]
LFGIYRKIYEINALSHGATYWFNKSMQNVYFLEDFAAKGFFPYLIHLVRDGRDVALSFKNAIVGDKHIYHLAKKWKEDQEISKYYIEKYGPERAITVQYENLLHDPENEIKRICRLLKIPYSEEILKYYESEESLITATSGEMWSNLTRPIISDNFDKYKNGLPSGEIILFESIAGNVLTDYGYRMENHFSGRELIFSNKDIIRFDLENLAMKQEFIQHASPLDLRKREAQNKLLLEIFERKSISMPL